MITDIKKRALHRSKILQGQLKGLEKMIQEEEYCIDILTQSLAIQKSLRSLNKLILENHLKTHVSKKIRNLSEPIGSKGQGPKSKIQNKTIKELLDIYELSSVRG